jgi:hypothetical protein
VPDPALTNRPSTEPSTQDDDSDGVIAATEVDMSALSP